MTEELKPCPHCNSKPTLMNGMGEYWVRCADCETPVSTEQSAVTAWNTRPSAWVSVEDWHHEKNNDRSEERNDRHLIIATNDGRVVTLEAFRLGPWIDRAECTGITSYPIKYRELPPHPKESNEN